MTSTAGAAIAGGAGLTTSTTGGAGLTSAAGGAPCGACASATIDSPARSEEHTSELQSRLHLVCRLLLEKKKFDTASRSWTLVGSMRRRISVSSDRMRIGTPYS